MKPIIKRVSFICLLALCLSGFFFAKKNITSAKADAASKPKEPFATVFITGNTLGSLQPCGCAGGQLGGFDRREAVFSQISNGKKMTIDTGNFIEADTQQDIIKFGIIFQALSMLQYDLVNLSEEDLRIAKDLGLLDDKPAFNVITSQDTDDKIPSVHTRQIQLGRICLSINFAVINAQSAQMELLESLFPENLNGPSLNMLMINDCEQEVIMQVAHSSKVDIVICPPLSDEPEMISEKEKKPLLITAGKLGKYIGKLTIEVTPQNDLKLNYTKIPVEEQLPQNEELVQLYKDYQLMVKEEGLIKTMPRVPLPNELEYIGSKSCAMSDACHEYEYDKWYMKKHAHAYRTLVDVGSQYDPECIKCHVVGFGYEQGYISDETDEQLRNVGCEVCHGPGSDHMAAILLKQEDSQTTEPKILCLDCHTTEHSPDYQGHEEEYLKKVTHWKEPKQDKDVKE